MRSIKNLTNIVSMATLATAMLAQPMLAETPAIDVTATSRLANKDIAGRGFIFSATPVFHNGVSVSKGPLYANFEQTNYATQGRQHEFFYNNAAAGTSFKVPMGTLGVEASSVNVAGLGRTNELFAKLTTNAPLSPSIEYAIDTGADSGQYVGLGAKYSASKGPFTFGVEGSVGYNHHMSTDISGFSHARLDMSASAQLSPKVSIDALVRAQKALSPAFKDAQMAQLGVSYKF